MTHPARAMPWKTTGYQIVLGAKTATTSPLRRPASCSAAANRSTYAASSPCVIVSPEIPSTSAGASGRSAADASTNSGTDRFGISTSGYGLASATVVLLVQVVAPVSQTGPPPPHRGYPPVGQRGQSTDWVHRNSAIVFPVPATVTTASQTCVVRPAWALVATTSMRPSVVVPR